MRPDGARDDIAPLAYETPPATPSRCSGSEVAALPLAVASFACVSCAAAAMFVGQYRVGRVAGWLEVVLMVLLVTGMVFSYVGICAAALVLGEKQCRRAFLALVLNAGAGSVMLVMTWVAAHEL
jgi:hypothetical protein